jgi:hypothetical protein
VKIIWQEDETAKGPFLEEPIEEDVLIEDDEEEEQQPSAGQGFGW